MTKGSGHHKVSGKRPLPLGNTLASGIILVSWGLLFSFFPDYAKLWPTPSFVFQVLSIFCYILGALVAIGGFNELTSNPIHRGLSFSLGFGAVASILHVASANAATGLMSLVLKALVLMILMIGIMVIGMEVPRMFAKPMRNINHNSASNLTTPEISTAEESRTRNGLEISVNFMVALVGFIGAVIQLVNTLLGD